MKEERSDRELAKEIRSGSENAFETVFSRYWKPLYAFVFRLINDEDLTKDILQNTFLEIWKRKESLFATDSLMPLLVKIAKNEVITLFRRDKVRLAGDEILIRNLQQIASAEEHLIATELQGEIDRELTKMPLNMRQCFHLSKYENRSVKEIAAELMLSEQTVKNNISEALKRLKLALLVSNSGYLALVVPLVINLT
ncbi:sigma-70 family RNA polymerase sigma factor [Pedobacter sp. MC2016-15]|uniref:RNA polymerase sigma factor n=1 Tax=Pedobacter sp. MC2016-15 TaxID=2994473 RepID=UPI0022469A1A|nr:sigma-70 family RNA polymerase sigma factor [Pedobacter sp. MC2016-15]MCX2481399.1 sigma-70 family RNA polymerase sigma factor [Pedobacter sp. MC2016-15]